MKLDWRVRWLIGVIGLAFAGMSTVMAWVKPDAAIVVGFLTAGLVLALLAVMPKLPSKVSIGGGSLEYSPDQLIDQEYTATLESELWSAISQAVPELYEESPEGTGGTAGPGLEEARQSARMASTQAEMNAALEAARGVARRQAQLVLTIREHRKKTP
jgi:hypothetical protein